MTLLRFGVASLLLGTLVPAGAAAQPTTDPLATLQATMVSAEASLKDGELQVAESQYRAALMQGWMLIGGAAGAEGRLADARQAFERASTSAAQPREALHQLAAVYLQEREAAVAINILTKLVARDPKDVGSRRLLAQALASSGQPKQAVGELEKALQLQPDDPELKFVLASGYLRIKNAEEAERLFVELAKARPMAETYVLIGRTWRDAGEYARARAALQKAIAMNPRVGRARYYLGTVALREEGVVRLDEAIADFEQELKIQPSDPITTLRLGIAYVLAKRPNDALPLLERATASEQAPADGFHYLGRCLLDLDRPQEAVTALNRALELTSAQPKNQDQLSALRNIHYQLGLALRKAEVPEEAAKHFAAAEQSSEKATDAARADLARYLADTPDLTATDAVPPREAVFPMTAAPASARAEITRVAKTAVTRAYLNIGVMHAQAQRFARAAELFEQAAGVDPDFPQVQYSLGVAYFNAKEFAKATAPLARVLAANPADLPVRRMLGVAWLNAEAYDKAVALLVDDPGRQADPQLQLAYGIALVRSDHPKEAEAVFSSLIAEHGDSPEVNLLLGQANAAQGDFDAAVQALERAIKAKPDIVGAHASLGFIYMKQGKLPEAEAALRAERAVSPADVQTRHTLAAVLDLQGRADEAIAIERAVLRVRPEFADARYLLGKLLLSQGAALEASEHLEAAARIAPEDANIHYQLGQAYTKLGRTELAQEQFEVFRQLKDKQGGRTK
jgi:tetratricopeptide (TPR) repeat protein